jgi:hypothetical protein
MYARTQFSLLKRTLLRFDVFLPLCQGGRFLEAPVSGSKAQAEGGVLIMICAGDRPLYDEIEGNDLKAMGKVTTNPRSFLQ